MSAQSGRRFGYSPVVLIVDNQSVLMDVLGGHPSIGNVRLVGASSGDEAKTLFEFHRPDVVVLGLPISGGIDFLQYLRTVEMPCAVIALTDSAETRQRLEACGIEVILNRNLNLKIGKSRGALLVWALLNAFGCRSSCTN